MENMPIHSFVSALGAKYAVVTFITAVIISVALELLNAKHANFAPNVIWNSITLTAILLALCFVVYVIYQLYHGATFTFLPLWISSSIIFFSMALMIAVRSSALGDTNFNIIQGILPLIASVLLGAVFSIFIKVAQRLIT